MTMVLTKRNWIALLLSGLLLQGLQGVATPFAPLVWFAAIPLLVIVRTTPWHVGLPIVWLMMTIGRSLLFTRPLHWPTYLLITTMMLVPMIVHRLAHARFPRVGLFGFPLAMVVVERIGAQLQVLPSTTWPLLWSTQSGNVGLMAHSDWLPTAMMTACVAWTQAIMAGFGELHLVRERLSQEQREGGLGQQTVLFLFTVWIGLHGSGWLRHWFG
jgi:hypothetical protein